MKYPNNTPLAGRYLLSTLPLLLLVGCGGGTQVSGNADDADVSVLPALLTSNGSDQSGGAAVTNNDSQSPSESVRPLLLPGPDRDGDGLRNLEDQDDDNDGILDIDEGAVDANSDGVLDAASRDSDHDGTPDAWDLDSDNDGITDMREIIVDDFLYGLLDQVPNGAIDVTFSTGVNGIADMIETAPDSGILIYQYPDSDGDGERNVVDLDSDNDSIPDLVEAGGSDLDGNGRIDNFTDADGKGVDDRLLATGLELFDTDGDGTPDYLDSDSDGDGLSDRDEAGPNGSQPRDTDGDGAADYRELDSDNDGVQDGHSPAFTVSTGTRGSCGIGNLNSNSNNGGSSSGPDRDGDGIANMYDLDDDNDGVLDIDEGAVDTNGDGFLDAGSRDRDHDGTPDAWDLDSDNDGISDLRETLTDPMLATRLDLIRNGAIDISFPVGSNGLADVIETYADSGTVFYSYADTDSDGERDALDLDSDNDSIPDLVEAGGVDANGDGMIDGFCDADGKGVDDRLYASGLEIFDTDQDGTADFRDLDSDGDGRSDRQEAGSNGSHPRDTDGNGAPDYRQIN